MQTWLVMAHRNGVGWLVLAVVLASSCSGYETRAAKEKLDAANKANEEAADEREKADKEKADAAAERDDEKRQAGGKKCEKRYADAIETLEESEDLLEQASKLKLRKELSEYLSARLKHVRKEAELTDLHRRMCSELAKEKLDTAAPDKLVEEARAARKVAEELYEEAVELRKKSKD